MPVRFTTTDSSGPNYLIPAPFVNINKTFDKQGDGEILGSRYTIQLDGWLIANRGSPKGDGSFIREDVDVIDADTSVQGGEDTTGWYEALQAKQKALSNLVSKIENGSLLEVQPLDASKAGFSAYVRLESVDLPCHDPGDPFKSKYTINLSCDYLLGPTSSTEGTCIPSEYTTEADCLEAEGDWTASSLQNDRDDWSRLEKWMVSAASESYQVEESENSSVVREEGEIKEGNRVYSLTRTISATGKNKFDDYIGGADGVEADGFTQTYAENGRAWQQARGYVYDIIRYGNQFIFGHDDKEHTYTPDGPGVTVEGYAGGDLPQGRTVPVNTTEDPDDYHLYSLNLPTAEGGNSDKPYKSFNYKRIPNIDVKGGSFSVTETWILAPTKTYATETVEISTQENNTEAEIQVTINGTIEGVLDNADDLGIGKAANEDKSAKREDPVNENLHFTGEVDSVTPSDKDNNSKYQNALYHWKNSVQNNLAKTAEGIAQKAFSPRTKVTAAPINTNVTHQVIRGIITYSTTFTATKNASGNSGNKYIPYVISEDLSINDTYPGQTFAEQLVLGRKLGPVLQDIGTQTHWLREFTIQCKVNSSDVHICVDEEDEITAAVTYDECTTGKCVDYAGEEEPTDEEECKRTEATEEEGDVAPNGSWIPTVNECNGADGEYTDQTSCEANGGEWTYGSDAWIANPNYAGIGTSNTKRTNSENALFNSISEGNLFTTNMITSKPGYTLPGQQRIFELAKDDDDFKVAATTCPDHADNANDPDISQIGCHWPKYKQFIAIKKLLNSLDPMTYIGEDYTDFTRDQAQGEDDIPNAITGGNRNVTKRFTNAPSESWNPKTGDWSYSVSWIYELNDPHTIFSSSFFNSAFVDKLHIPIDASKSANELSRTAPGQYF